MAEPPASQLRRFEFQRTLMGVPFAAAFYAPDEASANKAIEAVWARIEHLNSLMSDYDSNSELMRLCKESGPANPVRVSPELFYVLSKSAEFSKLSDGAFDVTVGELVKLWRRARRRGKIDDFEHLRESIHVERSRVGWRKIALSPDPTEKSDLLSETHPQKDRPACRSYKAGFVELRGNEMRLDLGGIAVGFACDEAICILKQHGITRAMIDGSGDIVVSDPPPGATGWRIGIASLREPDAPPKEFATLANCSISTSGDAYQFVVINGRRYSHIVDPKTGYGLTERSSVTVIAPDGITADALATSACVLGPERGLKLIESQPGVAALIATLDGDKLTTRQTSNWSSALKK